MGERVLITETWYYILFKQRNLFFSPSQLTFDDPGVMDDVFEETRSHSIRTNSAQMWILKLFTSPLNGLKTNFPKPTEGFRC
jgi:hypothetical protein